MQLPIEPMSPISQEEIPSGDEWGYQIKWDGVRIIAHIHDGQVTLYSRNGLIKNHTYPELVKNLAALSGRMIVDGEAVVIDPAKQRPSFQLVLQRERLKQANRITNAVRTHGITYILFDLLEQNEEDLRKLPYQERHNRLKEAFPIKEDWLLVTDLFIDGQALWQWVEQNGWEGIVSKRLSAPYREGKRHKDWYKKKTIQQFDVSIVGLTFKEGQLLSSMIMMLDGQYFGRVSLGLNESLKHRILKLPSSIQSPFALLPPDLKNVRVTWLQAPFNATVSGLEITNYGQLRHPKIVQLRLE